MKPLIIGESNPYGGDPYFALYPSPDGCAGHRLCELILDMRRFQYLEVFDRTNLCAGPWRIRDARGRAIEILKERAGRCKIVLLGAKVCAAFGVAYEPLVAVDEVMLRLPHPSGLCRLWNEPGMYARARAAVAAFLPEIAPLLGVST